MKNARSNSKEHLQIPAKTYRDVRANVTNTSSMHKSSVSSAGPKQFNKTSKLRSTHSSLDPGTYETRNTVLPSLRAQTQMKSDEKNASFYGNFEQPPNVHEIKEAYFGDGNMSDHSSSQIPSSYQHHGKEAKSVMVMKKLRELRSKANTGMSDYGSSIQR